MANYYDVKAAEKDRDTVKQIRRSITEVELELSGGSRNPEFVPDVMLIHRYCLQIMMQASNMIDRHEGTDFAPDFFTKAAQA